jgi:prepilin-type N-terminal cleavage/methylation domain-containing protein
MRTPPIDYRRVRQRGGRRARDAGFTFIELLVALLVFSIVSTIAFTVIDRMVSQGQAITDTITGAQEADQADQSIVQYLRGVTAFTSASSTAFVANADIGYNTSTGTSNSDTLGGTWSPGTGANDATFTVTVNGRQLSEYYALASQTAPIFIFYKDNGAGGLTALNSSASPTVPACALYEIYAVGIDIEFLAGPQHPTEGFVADRPSTLITTIFLRNPTNTTTTSSTTSTTTCPE